jgi:hypothetical protein
MVGCATTGTRTGHLGAIAGNSHLVTLVVTEDRSVIRDECPQAAVIANVLGCQTTRQVKLADGAAVRLVKIVRYTDRLPSALAFEIDLHELCHAVAGLQRVSDPCHVGNDGVVQHHPAALPRGLNLR